MLPSEYKKTLNFVFSANARNGFVDWRSADALLSDVMEIIDLAKEELLRASLYEDLFSLVNYAYITWGNIDIDDSNGETTYFCAYIREVWDLIYNEGSEIFPHSKMLPFFFESLDDKVVVFMEDSLYSFLLVHFKEPDELAAKERFLSDKMASVREEVKTNNFRQYHLYVLEEYYIRVIADMKLPIEEIRSFAANSGSYSMQEYLAEIEAEYGNYDEAIRLYEDRIAQRPDAYWSNEPRTALMEIYKKIGDTESYNRVLYDKMLANIGNTDLFLEYKALFSKEEWPDKWNDILEILKETGKTATSWYAIEERFDLIMDTAEPDFYMLVESYKDELKKLYPDRCLNVLINATNRAAGLAKDRKGYKTIRRYLSMFKDYADGKQIAHRLADEYRDRWPRRRAMFDELKKF